MPTHGKAWMVTEKKCWPACLPCYEAYIRRNKRATYRRDKHLTVNLVDAEKATTRIHDMIGHYGRSMRWICATSGLDMRTLTALKAGRRLRVLQTTDEAIAYAYESVVGRQPLNPKQHVNFVDSTAAVNAIRGMVRQGYTRSWIAHKIGMNEKTMSVISCGRQKHVMRDTSESLVYLARQLGSSQGPSVIARAAGVRSGWSPTMEHDELV